MADSATALSKKIKNLEDQLSELKAEFKKLTNRKPRAIPYSIDELVDYINNDNLPEPLIVGDYIETTYYTGEPMKIVVAGISHDTMENGKGADYSFVSFIDISIDMNETNTNKTSWKDCKARLTHMPRLMKLLPEVLQKNIVPVKKYTSAGGESKKIIETIDKLFLFSEVEMLGTHNRSYDGEGKQYKLFTDKDNVITKNYPWLRSPAYNSSSHFCYVNFDGLSFYNSASSAHGVVFGFCLSSNKSK